MTTAEKLTSLRDLMSEQGFAAYIIPSTDPHQSEYIADHWKTRQWFSGFTGSAGTVVVTQDFAGLWTDSRYFIQAEKELQGSGIELVKLKIPHTPEYVDWLKEKLDRGSVVGINGKVFSESLVSSMKKAFLDKGIKINCGLDLPGMIWKDRPPVSMNGITEHDLKYAGKSRKEKLARVREEMEKEGAGYHLLTSLDDIAWVFNLRGTDVDYNPVFISYALISKDTSTLFVDEHKLGQELRDKLVADSVTVEPYEKIDETLTALEIGSGIMFSTSKTSHYINLCIPPHCKKIDSISIVTRLKACKDETEITNIRNAMVKDGVALVKFFKWLEENIGKEAITEITLDEKLTSIRASQKGYTGNSFGTIAGYKDHGAIVHYDATPESAYPLSAEGILLLDSGAQYLDGTTDITRTITLGKPTEEQVRDYTLVLKGLIQLSLAIFPEGTKGFHLDVLARKALWEHSKNYGHGTGHGVGYFLNVHEGPQGITPNAAVNTALEPGMIQSNEPGYYKEGEYGIRLENLILVTEHSESEYGRFLQFDTITLFPFDTNLIDMDLLSEREKGWLNRYHKKVFERLSPGLTKEENQWLLKKTKNI
jgi:Xaa-Pro aminopeptidase